MSSLQDNNFEHFDSDELLEQFVISVPTISSSIFGQAVKDIFDKRPDREGVVVLENSHPVGIIMRTTFFQKIGTLYGISLYMNRPINILMETSIMEVETTDNISKIGIKAMSREQSKLYDYIVAYKNKTYIGVISIRLFLVELSKRNEAQINVLKDQQQKLLMANEQEVVLRENLEYQSASVRNLLDHADQGFLWFGNDLIVKKEFSYKCISIFNKSIGTVRFLDLVTSFFGEDKISVFNMVFDSFFKNNSSITDNVYLMLLPSDCVILGKTIHFEYRRIENDSQKAVMVILNDITEKVNMEKTLEDDRNRQRLIIKAFGCQAQIKQILDEFRDIFSGGYRDFFDANRGFNECLNELFRAVHTYKGDFAQYGFIDASEKLHVFEDKLQGIINLGEKAAITDVENIMLGVNPEKILEYDLGIIYEVLGDSYFDKSEIVSIPKSKLTELEKRIQNGGDSVDRASVISLIKSLQLKNIKIYLNQYGDYLQYLSGRVMKSMPTFIIEGDDVEIDGDKYAAFLKSLVHIFRNIMDHGIETDEERLERAKPENGVVKCRVSHLDDRTFSIRISDDGRGIDIAKLKDKAIKNGLYTADTLNKMTEKEACDLIFTDHLSTKDNADTLSGRGMGMAAVLHACQSLGGKIETETEKGKGTLFVITLPYLTEV